MDTNGQNRRSADRTHVEGVGACFFGIPPTVRGVTVTADVAMPTSDPDMFGNLPDAYWPVDPKRFTGQLARKQEITYRAVVSLSGHLGSHEIARILNVSTHTVQLILSQQSSEVARHKDIFGAECLRTAAKLRRRVEEQVDYMEGKDAAIALGILTEKGLLLMGEATAIVEQRGPSDRAGFEAWLRQVREVESSVVPDSQSGVQRTDYVDSQCVGRTVANLERTDPAISRQKREDGVLLEDARADTSISAPPGCETAAPAAGGPPGGGCSMPEVVDGRSIGG